MELRLTPAEDEIDLRPTRKDCTELRLLPDDEPADRPRRRVADLSDAAVDSRQRLLRLRDRLSPQVLHVAQTGPVEEDLDRAAVHHEVLLAVTVQVVGEHAEGRVLPCPIVELSPEGACAFVDEYGDGIETTRYREVSLAIPVQVGDRDRSASRRPVSVDRVT